VAVLIPIFYTATVMPFHLLYLTDNNGDVGWFSIEVIISILFGLDMIFNFNLAFEDSSGTVVSDRQVPLCGCCVDARTGTCRCYRSIVALIVAFRPRRKKIAVRYFKTWFIFDLLSLIPFGECVRAHPVAVGVVVHAHMNASACSGAHTHTGTRSHTRRVRAVLRVADSLLTEGDRDFSSAARLSRATRLFRLARLFKLVR
jgi:hypothetical protein